MAAQTLSMQIENLSLEQLLLLNENTELIYELNPKLKQFRPPGSNMNMGYHLAKAAAMYYLIHHPTLRGRHLDDYDARTILCEHSKYLLKPCVHPREQKLFLDWLKFRAGPSPSA